MFQDLNPLDRTTAFLEIGIMLLGAAIIGFLTAWLIQRARKPRSISDESNLKNVEALRMAKAAMAQQKKRLEKTDIELDNRQRRIDELEEKLKEKSKPSVVFTKELEELKERLAESESKRSQQQKELEQLKMKISSHQPATEDADPRVDRLQKEVAALTNQNNELRRQLESAGAEKEDRGRIDQLQKELSAEKAHSEELRKKLEARPEETNHDLERQLRQQKIELVQKTADIASLQNKLMGLEQKLKAAPGGGEGQPLQRISELEKELQTIRETATQQEKQLKKAAESAREAEKAATDLQALRERLKTLEVENLSLKAKPADGSPDKKALSRAEAQITELQARLAAAEAQLKEQAVEPEEKTAPETGDPSEVEWLRKEKEDQEEEIAELEETILNLEKDNARLRSRVRDKTGAQTEKQLQELEKERDDLRAQLNRLRKTSGDGEEAPPLAQPDFSHLGAVADGERDDFSQVEGIGPAMEQKLNELGITTFRQISKLTAEDMARIEGILELPPGRVKREKWAKQAKKLLK